MPSSTAGLKSHILNPTNQHSLVSILPIPSVYTLHNEVGPGGPPCAPPYVRHVRICGTLVFLFHSAPGLSLSCDAPPVCIIWANLFPFSHFSFQMTSFPVGFLFQCTLM
jgi:hypothetical protein